MLSLGDFSSSSQQPLTTTAPSLFFQEITDIYKGEGKSSPSTRWLLRWAIISSCLTTQLELVFFPTVDISVSIWFVRLSSYFFRPRFTFSCFFLSDGFPFFLFNLLFLSCFGMFCQRLMSADRLAATSSKKSYVVVACVCIFGYGLITR